MDEQYSLVEILAGASIHDIRYTCKYPDWLGYLGLALMYSRDAEQVTRALTKAWVPQLIEERAGTRAQQLLQSILASNTDVLTWHHLETLE